MSQFPLGGPGQPIEAMTETEARLDRLRRRSGFFVAPLAFLAVWLATRGQLAPEAARLCAVLALVGVLWITEGIPLPATAILGPTLCVVLGIADAKTALRPFADPIIFLFIGSFMLARAMTVHGLDRRIALMFLRLVGRNAGPVRVLVAIGLISAALSMWVSNTATTAMMLPIALGVLRAMAELRGIAAGQMNRWPYATGLLLSVAYGASIGGIGTPVGSPPNLIGIAALRKYAGIDVNFLQWMSIGVPLLVVMFIALAAVLLWLHPAGKAPAGARGSLGDCLAMQRATLGRWTPGQVNTLIAFSAAIVLWIVPPLVAIGLGREASGPKAEPALRPSATSTSPAAPAEAAGYQRPWVRRYPDAIYPDSWLPGVARFVNWSGRGLPEAIVALVAACLLFVLPAGRRDGEWQFTLAWPEAARIDWGTVLLFGGGLSLGELIFATGVSEAMGNKIIHFTGTNSLWGLTAASIALAILLSESTSNTAACNMLMPVVIPVAQAAGVNPAPVALGAILGASFGFMLPISTPPNAIAYGSGLVPITRMVRAGVLFDVLGFAVIWLGLRLLCPLLDI